MLKKKLIFCIFNIVQAVYTDHFAEVDGTSQSLLSFTGNKNVHGLYDFLLNHRYI
jgi:protein downstream neighbor of Son